MIAASGTAALLRDPRGFLDGDAWRERLAPLAPAGAPERVTPEYVRAKRGRSLLMGVTIEWRTENGRRATRGSIYVAAGGVADAWSKASTLRLVGPGAGPALGRLPEPDALFLAFPNDRALRGLSAAADPRRLGNRLAGEGFPFGAAGLSIRARRTDVSVARWKVGRRAVLRARLALRQAPCGLKDTREVWIRVYPAAALALQRERWRLAAAHAGACRVPALLGADAERGFLVTSALEGHPLAPSGPRTTHRVTTEVVEAVASALEPLHRAGGGIARDAGIPFLGTARLLAAALRPLDDLAAWRPDWTARIGRLAAALRREAPASRGKDGFLHGDLKFDQLLVSREGLAVLDWDEVAIGDPLADFASLAEDLDAAGAGPCLAAAVEALAARQAPAHFSGAAWRWHRAAAAARRALAGLQAGRADWPEVAGAALARAEAALARRGAGRVTRDGTRPESNLPGGKAPPIAALLAPAGARGAMLALPPGTWRLDAVWPDGDDALARLTDLRTGTGWWTRCGAAAGNWPSPDDPRLFRLAPLVRSGRFVLVAHRLGRRAALRHVGDDAFVHLREPRRAGSAFARLAAVHAALDGSGVPLPPPPALLDERDGWRVPAVAGTTFPVESAGADRWIDIGSSLASLHRTPAPPVLPVRGRARALRDLDRQARLRVAAGGPFGRWLGDAVARLEPGFTSEETTERIVHGDLHPAQLLCGRRTTWLDWEQAGAGEPEEDLGNFAAHVYWAAGPAVRTRWLALRDTYERQGGVVRPDAFRAYARIALLRLLSVHAWRDADRPRCEDRLDLWARWGEELRRW